MRRTHSASLIAQVLTLILAAGSVYGDGAKTGPKCLSVSSCYQGYPWSDGVETGLRAVLQGKCDPWRNVSVLNSTKLALSNNLLRRAKKIEIRQSHR